MSLNKGSSKDLKKNVLKKRQKSKLFLYDVVTQVADMEKGASVASVRGRVVVSRTRPGVARGQGVRKAGDLQ
jgi:hypothetical protein